MSDSDKHDQEHLDTDKPSLNHASIQETDESIGNHPVVTGHSRAHDPPITASPNTAALPGPEDSTLAVALVRTSPSLNLYQLRIYALIVSTLGVLLQSVEKLGDFKAVFYLLEKRMPTKAVSMTIESLNSLGINTRPLEHFKDEVFVMQDHYDTHYVLTLGVILASMSEDGYMSFMELARREYFRNVHPDNLKDPAKLVEKLLGGGKTEKKDLHNFFKWIALAGYRSQLKTLEEFCESHGIEKPDDFKPQTYPGNHSTLLIPPSLSSLDPPSAIPATLPPDVSLDGNHRVTIGDINNGTFHHFNNTQGGEDSHEDLTTSKDDETDRTDPPLWDFEPHPQAEKQGKRTKMVAPTSGNVSQAPPPTGMRGREDTHSERRSLSDTVRDYGSMSTNSHTKSLPLPINTSPPTQNGASLTPARPVTPPPTQNGASLTPARPVTPPPTQNRGVLAPDQPTPSTQNIDSANRDRPTITPSRELPTRSQIITDPSITTNRRKKMQWRRIVCILFAINVFLVLGLVGSLIAWLAYSDIYLFGLDSETKYVGGSVVSLLGCFNLYTKRVVVTRENDGDDYHFGLHLMKEHELFRNVQKNTLTCLPLQVDINNRNQALTCYQADRPIHTTEKGGIVSFNMTTICNETSPSSCQYVIYQFNSVEDYLKYTSDYKNEFPERIKKSKVVAAKSFRTSQQVDLKLLEGFNYFAVYAPKEVELVNVIITGYFTSYNISLPLPGQCTIDISTDHCTVPINDHSIVPTVGHDKVCVLAKSLIDTDDINSYPVTVAPHNSSINDVSLSMIALSFIFICLFLVFLCIGIKCCYKYKSSRAADGSNL